MSSNRPRARRTQQPETPPRHEPTAAQDNPPHAPESGRLSLYLLWGGLLGITLAAVVLNRGTKTAPAPAGPSAAEEIRAPSAAEPPSTPGTLALRDIWLETDEAHVRPQDCDELPPAWGAPDRARFDAALSRAGLDDATRARVLSGAQCDANGCATTPPDEVVAVLTPAQREGLYLAMRDYPQAVMLRAPFQRPVSRPPFSSDPRLPPSARAVIAAGEWTHGETRYFSDLPWLCHRVPDGIERVAFFRVMRARSGLDVSVRVRRGDDLDAVARWWAAGSSAGEVRARLERALADGSGAVPLRDLLPPAMRTRLGTYPPRGTRYDCFWTALNFFSPTADVAPYANRADFDNATAQWREVPLDALRFGDALAFRTPDGTTRHAAVYLAEDLVLTKDGWSMHRPWEVSRLGAVRTIYHDATVIQAFRRP